MNELKNRKKGILIWIAAGSIAVAMVLNFSMGLKNDAHFDLLFANIEALSRSEGVTAAEFKEQTGGCDPEWDNQNCTGTKSGGGSYNYSYASNTCTK